MTHRLRILAPLGAYLTVAVWGCSVVNKIDEVTPPVAATDGEVCPDDEAFCDGACVDITANAAHCGVCGNACGDGVDCEDGQCDIACDADQVACGGGCVDLQTDPENCGACNTPCVGGANQTAVCDAGACTVTCNDNFADCNGIAEDGCEAELLTDPQNCGACATSCLGPDHVDATCNAGTCGTGACITGFGDCDNNASNGCEQRIRNAHNHCGMCGMACGANQFCQGDTCQPFKVFATEGSGHLHGSLYELNTGSGAVTAVGDLEHAYVGMGFVGDGLVGVTDQGDMVLIDTADASEEILVLGPDNPRGARGLGRRADGLVVTCRSNTGRFHTTNLDTGADVELTGGNCSNQETPFSDGNQIWNLRNSRLETISNLGTETLVTNLTGANGTLRGATWHAGSIYALQCENQCNAGATHLVVVNRFAGTVTEIANLPVPNQLHALASPDPL